MATYIKRKTGILCQIRRKGHASISRTFDSKAEAERWALTIESKMGRGVYEDTREAFNTTLSDCLDRYQVEVSALKKSAETEKYTIQLWQQSTLASKPIGTVTSSDIAKWRNNRLKEVSGSTVRINLALLSHLYTIAFKEWGIPVNNPVAAIKIPPPGRARDRRLLPGEEKLLFDKLNPEMRVMVTLAIETAMRRSELAGLRREWIKGKVVTLPDTKNGTQRKVPLSTKALAVLSLLPSRIDGMVFSMSAKTVTYRFDRACEAAGITGLHFHDLRHEATSRLFERGLSVMEVQQITGHKTLQMLSRYTHINVDTLADKLG